MVPHFLHFGSASMLAVLASICNSVFELTVVLTTDYRYHFEEHIKKCKMTLKSTTDYRQ
jgi:hypothetical protein